MDQLDRLYRTLVQTIRASFPQYLTQPFEVQELYQTILPYRHHRRTLGFDTNQDYEAALLELLAGERGYLIVDERMRDALQRELKTPNPDPAVFREFASAQVSLAHEPLRQAERALESSVRTTETERVPAPAARASGAILHSGPATAAHVASTGEMPRASMPTPAQQRPSGHTPVARPSGARETGMTVTGERGVVVAQNEDCRFCGGRLPTGRHLVFCPHCGQNLTVKHCEACGTELELGWKFCISCGRSVTPG